MRKVLSVRMLNKKHILIYILIAGIIFIMPACTNVADNMERVDGFYLYLSDTEWITVNQPKDIISVDHYEITDHNYHNVGTEAEYESWFGHDWTQVWNKDGSGKWSELRDRHYGRDTMPLE